MAKGRAAMTIYLDFIKAFDMVCHSVFECIHSQIVDDTHLEVDTETRAVIQRNFEKQTNRNPQS